MSENILKRDVGIDVMKFFAVILITHSHMEALYPEGLRFLCTGGALGDALFFFCSGFTLFMKPLGRFDLWYGKRIRRIYPTIFAWAIIQSLLFESKDNFLTVILHGGGWFVSCIMIYYVILYVTGKYSYGNMWIPVVCSVSVFSIWYICMDRPAIYSIYGHGYIKWSFFFLFMLMGATLGKKRQQLKEVNRVSFSIIMLVCSVALFYAIFVASMRLVDYNYLQPFSIAFLLFAVYNGYRLANTPCVCRLYNVPVVNFFVRFIGGLCLEIYIVQSVLLKNPIVNVFPLNCACVILLIILTAYLLRSLSRIFLQTFSENGYNWKGVFKLI